MASVRLSQLTRQYNVGSESILTVLSQYGADVKDDLNWKVPVEYIPLLDIVFAGQQYFKTQSSQSNNVLKNTSDNSEPSTQTSSSTVVTVDDLNGISFLDFSQRSLWLAYILFEISNDNQERIRELIPEWKYKLKWIVHGPFFYVSEWITDTFRYYINENNDIVNGDVEFAAGDRLNYVKKLNVLHHIFSCMAAVDKKPAGEISSELEFCRQQWTQLSQTQYASSVAKRLDYTYSEAIHICEQLVGLKESITEDIDAVTDDETVELEVTSVLKQGQVITEAYGKYKACVLFPENISSEGKPISMAWLSHWVMDEFQKGKSYEFTLMNSKSNGDIGVLSYDIGTPNEDFIKDYESLELGKTYSVISFKETPNYYLVRLKDYTLFGVVLKSSINPQTDIDENGIMNLALLDKSDNPLGLLVFVKSSFIERISVHSNLNDFLKPEEMDAISEDNLKIVEYLLENYPNVTRENCDQITDDIYCRVPESSPMSVFLKSHPDYLNDRAFWLRQYQDKDTGTYRIVFFHEYPTISIEISQLDENQFVVSRFDSNSTSNITRDILRYNNSRACLKISASHLHFLNRYEAIPVTYSTDRSIDLILKLEDFNARIKREIRDAIIEKTRDSASDYYTLRNYLQFQKDQEEDSISDPIFVPAKSIESSSGAGIGGTAIKFRLNSEQIDRLLSDQMDTENGIHCAIVNENNEEQCTGVLTGDESMFYFDFDHGHLDIGDILEKGMSIRRRVNTRHIDIQISALNGFVKKDSIGIYQDLINGRMKPVDVSAVDKIDFINPNLKSAADNNNQSQAVKKALALQNKEVLLIQGPPGTGKTTIIVEIINQMVRQGKKVLVCSQAHAAVSNIHKRLDEDQIKILDLDEVGDLESMNKDFDRKVYADFLNHNSDLIRMIESGKCSAVDLTEKIEKFQYPSDELTKKYQRLHRNLCEYYHDQANIDKDKILDVIDCLKEETSYVTGLLLQSQMYSTMDVVMGTCIGIGMNKVLRSCAVRFDMVIIDEAGKANLAETIVPMKLADRFVLVGDHKQLPPYIDRQEIDDFVKDQNDSSDNNESVERISREIADKSLSNSLFADFFEHPNFPVENKVTLNYQFRMNPKIGDYISKLFYEGKLKSGAGTEKQNVYIDGYPEVVTFVDTTTRGVDPDNDPRETKTLDRGVYNSREVNIICNEILPAVQKAMEADRGLTLGIITPYNAQNHRLKQALQGSGLEHCVHTIDSIQGNEFDIVVFSFVRSFSRSATLRGERVGFLDDMRRLNVSLSRAKKKLILVGNRNTLEREEAHRKFEDFPVPGMLDPVTVFRSIAENVKVFTKAGSVEGFLAAHPVSGDIYESCPCRKVGNYLEFDISVGESIYTFNMPYGTFKPFDLPDNEFDTIDIVYRGIDEKTGKPLFYPALLEKYSKEHSVGEELVGIVKRVFPKTETQSAFSLVDMGGVIGFLKMNSHNDLNAPAVKVDDMVNVCILNYDFEKRRILLKKNDSFIGIVLKKRDYPQMDVKLEDGSVFTFSEDSFWFVAHEGQSYIFAKFGNGKIILHKQYYEEFKAMYQKGSKVRGEVLGENKYCYVVGVDSFWAVVSKEYLRGRLLALGEKRTFSVFKFNDYYKSVTLGL